MTRSLDEPFDREPVKLDRKMLWALRALERRRKDEHAEMLGGVPAPADESKGFRPKWNMRDKRRRNRK